MIIYIIVILSIYSYLAHNRLLIQPPFCPLSLHRCKVCSYSVLLYLDKCLWSRLYNWKTLGGRTFPQDRRLLKNKRLHGFYLKLRSPIVLCHTDFSLRRRRNLTSVSDVCEAAVISCWGPGNGINELLEVRSEFPFILIGKLPMAF